MHIVQCESSAEEAVEVVADADDHSDRVFTSLEENQDNPCTEVVCNDDNTEINVCDDAIVGITDEVIISSCSEELSDSRDVVQKQVNSQSKT